MAKVVLIHSDKAIRAALEALTQARHEVLVARDLKAGIKQIAASRPDLIVVGHDAKKQEGIRLLRHLRDNVSKTPVIVVVTRGLGVIQPMAMKLGARGFIEYPVDPARYQQAIDAALQASEEAKAGPPPITDEELNSNLSMLETDLNRRMKCFAGRNQVYLYSKITGGVRPRPRISLRCGLRAEFGLDKHVYYEFIRDVCCKDPGQCKAVQLYRARESA